MSIPTPIPFDNTYANLPAAFFESVEPTPVRAPSLIQWNRELADELGIDADLPDTPEGLAVLAGNRVPEGAQPLAMAYSGHQFGGFSPQLGDGRAILLGEVTAQDGTRRDIQLKGSGPTPFSRRGDGRSALGPVLREYLVSEAMHAIGVPTTRALAAVHSGEKVFRETMLDGGIFTRVAKSHIRVGTFQWFAARQDFDNLRVLADYAIDRHYPDAAQDENPHLSLLCGLIRRQAGLVAHWMQIGFIHGVMNTDNFSVSGETIDFGPCAFLDEYHPDKTFSSIDRHGRYAFGNQAAIAHWNLTRFAETLLPLMDADPEKAVALAEQALVGFVAEFEKAWSLRLCRKIGIAAPGAEDRILADSLLEVMVEEKADFTLTFRHLSAALDPGSEGPFTRCFDNSVAAPVSIWLERWRSRMSTESLPAAISIMRATNPVFIPRNHRLEAVIAAGYQGDFAPFHRLHEVLRNPFTEQPENAEFENAPAPDEVVCATFCGT